MSVAGQPVRELRPERLASGVHRRAGAAARQGLDAVALAAARHARAGRARHVLRPVAGHHRSAVRVQDWRTGVPHDVPVGW